LDETEAKNALQRQRAGHKQQAEQQRQETELQARALIFIPEARRRLSMAGSYNETDVWPVALDFARADLHQHQKPRQGDREQKQIAATVRQRGE
jgi:hypothetical protein